MVAVKKVKSAFIIFLVTGLILGFISGFLSMLILISYRMDKLHKKKEYLEAIISDKDTKLLRLEDLINNNKFVIKNIEIILNSEELSDEVNIEKNIKEKYSPLLGKEVKSVDPELAIEIVNNRIFRFNSGEYSLKVSKITVSEILKVWVDVEVID